MSSVSDLKMAAERLLRQKDGARARVIQHILRLKTWDEDQLKWLLGQIEKLPDKEPEPGMSGAPVERGRVHV